MRSMNISDIKDFMSHLLLRDTFDHFLLLEGTVTTFNTFFVDGHLNKDYYATMETPPESLMEDSLSQWSSLRPFFLSLIKGKHAPLGFKIIFQLPQSHMQTWLSKTTLSVSADHIKALFLNLKYDGKNLTCTTGISLGLFTLDKSPEYAWDENIAMFLTQKGIPFEPE